MQLQSRLVKSRHGIYYLRLQRYGIDKRVSLRTRDLSVASIAAHSLGATISAMDIKKIKGYTLKTSGEGIEIITDGSYEDHERAKDTLVALVMAKAEAQSKPPSNLSSNNNSTQTPLKRVSLVDAIKDYEPILNKSKQAEKSKRMALSTLNGLSKILGTDFDTYDLDNEIIENVWLEVRLKQVAETTAKRDLSFIRTFSQWATEKSHYCPAPITFTIDAKSQHWAYFKQNDLKLIFDNLIIHAKKPWHFYLPLIGLFTGARIGEIAGLKTEHIFFKADLNVMHLPGTKTDASPRNIPVHQTLVNLGLIDYAESRRKSGHVMLFDITLSKQNGFGAAPSKWFTNYKNLIGLSDPKKVFHSFRHTIIDHMNQMDVSHLQQCQYTGHDKGGGVHNDVYGRNEISLQSMQSNLIEKLNWAKYCNWSLDENVLKEFASKFIHRACDS